ncbi:MAG: hypothetical protein QXW35_04085 [Candidatus Aenigmatarchaeota archaeon]
MTEAEKIEQIRKAVQEVIDTTECGYCKEIFGDVKKIIDTYMEIMDKADQMYNIASKQKKYLSEVNKKADQLITTQKKYYEAEPVTESVTTSKSQTSSGILGFNILNTNTRGPIRRIINKRIQSTNEKLNKIFELKIF